MKSLFTTFLTCAVIFAPFPFVLNAQDSQSTETVTEMDVTAYKEAMKQAIDEQKSKIKTLKDTVFNLKAPVIPGAGNKLINDTLMLEVKEALYKNFIDSPLAKDPDFQSHLLRVMNQTTITEDELKDLQKDVDAAKIRLKK